MGTGHEDAEARGFGDQQQPQARGDEQTGGEAAGQEADTRQRQLEEEKIKAEKYLSNWQRAEADLANYRRRSELERAELAKFANASLIGRILPVVDDFERALGAVPEGQRSTGWVEGMRLIDRKLRALLDQEGVTPIDALGREFDPHVHEAVMREDGEGDLDVVVEEFQKGYKLHDRVIRPTMVKVGKRSSVPAQSEKE